MQRPILHTVTIRGQTYQIRGAYNGQFETFVVDHTGQHAIHIGMHESIEKALKKIHEYADRSNVTKGE